LEPDSEEQIAKMCNVFWRTAIVCYKLQFCFTVGGQTLRGVNRFEKSIRDWKIYGIFLGFNGIYGIYEIFLRFMRFFWDLWDSFEIYGICEIFLDLW